MARRLGVTLGRQRVLRIRNACEVRASLRNTRIPSPADRGAPERMEGVRGVSRHMANKTGCARDLCPQALWTGQMFRDPFEKRKKVVFIPLYTVVLWQDIFLLLVHKWASFPTRWGFAARGPKLMPASHVF